MQNNDEKNYSENCIRASIKRRNLHLDGWVQSLPKMPSHYCHLRSKRLYLEGPFDNKQEVYNLYVEHCTEEKHRPLSKSFYIYNHFLDFKNHQHYKSIRPGRTKGDPEVKDIRSLKYDPITHNIQYKLSFDDDYKDLPQRKLKIKNLPLLYPKMYKKQIPLTKSKWDDLQKLKPFLPTDTHTFYDLLPHANEHQPKTG